MKLYLISQDENAGYDTFDGAVVCAETVEEAKTIHPSENNNDWGEMFSSWCSSPEKVLVEYIGEACETQKKGVVLSSFNAG